MVRLARIVAQRERVALAESRHDWAYYQWVKAGAFPEGWHYDEVQRLREELENERQTLRGLMSQYYAELGDMTA